MEENKTDFKKEQNANKPNGENGGQGGRRRRNRHHRGGHGNHNANKDAVNVNNANAQNNQNGQKPQKNEAKNNAPQVQNAQKQNQNSQNNQNNGNNNANGSNKKKNKQKQPKPQQNNEVKAVAKEKEKDHKEYVENSRKKDENRKDTYVYVLDGNLYINLTNKCSNGCDFCVRNERDSYYGNYLWLRHGDPTVEKVIAATKGMGDLTRFKEAVFCGFGEPTYRVAEMVELCDYFHEKGLKTRLNTNGQGNLINKRDIVPDLKDKLDLVNISLNASCVEKYQPICRSQFGEAGFNGLIEFAKLCRRNGVPCRFSIVDCIGEAEVEACKRLAQSVNIPLYVRDYITDS